MWLINRPGRRLRCERARRRRLLKQERDCHRGERAVFSWSRPLASALAGRIESELHELRTDILGRDPLELPAAAAALHCVTRQEPKFGAHISLAYLGPRGLGEPRLHQKGGQKKDREVGTNKSNFHI